MKKLLGVFLSLMMVLPLIAVMFVTTAAAVTVVSGDTLVIKADLGDVITLADYTVDGLSGDLTWTDSSGTAVTEYVPVVKGAAKFTASNGTGTATVYVLAKGKYESDYVIFETDFSEYTSIDDMTDAGWSFVTNGTSTLENGAFNINTGIASYYRVLLPSWIGDFGNYSVTVNAQMSSVVDKTRWFAIMYRIQDPAVDNNYYHMCV